MWIYITITDPNRLLNPFFNQSHTHTGVFAHAAQQEEYTVHIHKHREQAQSYIETFPVVMVFSHRFIFTDELSMSFVQKHTSLSLQ